MNKFLVLIACVGFVAAEPLYGISASQYRYQDELGQHAFGHVGGPNSREEVKTADGVTRGSYSYVDGHGLVQSAVYAADAAGFRVAATNLPVGPAVPASDAVVAAAPAVVAPSVVAAPAVAAAPAVIAARTILPGVFPHAAVVHSLKKRDVIAVAKPLTSYPGSTGPLVHHAVVPTPLIAHTPYVAHPYVAHPYVASPFAHVLKKRSVLVPGPVVPLDTPEVAHAKAASLIQQNTEAIRNTYGGIPLALPADTPEVAAGKIAHSLAHARASIYPGLYSPYSPYLHVLKKRSVYLAHPLAYTTAIHPSSLSVPLDEPIVAHAKAANLIQQNTEAIRNNVGGIPLALPADTPEVAAGKIAHSIAHARQAAAVTHPFLYHL